MFTMSLHNYGHFKTVKPSPLNSRGCKAPTVTNAHSPYRTLEACPNCLMGDSFRVGVPGFGLYRRSFRPTAIERRPHSGLCMEVNIYVE